MDIQSIITQLTSQFGGAFDTAKVTNALHGMDLSKFDFSDIVKHLTKQGLLGDLDGDGKVESPLEEVKGKAAQIFGGLFGKKG